MSATITVNINELRAASLFTGKHDIRHYLNGVQVSASGKFIRLASTDGCYMAMFNVESDNEVLLESAIIPTDMIDRIKAKNCPVEITVGDRLDPDIAMRPVSLTCDGVTIAGNTIDGKFPDVDRVIPSRASGESAQFSLDLLATFVKAAKVLGRKSWDVTLAHNGLSAGIVNINGVDNFFGVVMPRRMDAPTEPPEWYRAQAGRA